MSTFGQEFKKAREKRGLSQEAAARQIDTTLNSVYRWETDRDLPRLREFQKILRAWPEFESVRVAKLELDGGNGPRQSAWTDIIALEQRERERIRLRHPRFRIEARPAV